ncbi:pyridoxal-phosphate dependent enzyme [Dechloromonas denitrificans]|uniref:pyridoxal-phosphate dependent enzyme n=1 Tax=Dechloromonas denitrificans TaxID=281362 RepID=UPI001CF91CE8|nr:cystathionine beta-synthase [Dechloromonas denitrificans]UCV05601.1 cystathionine beta-synthase [Dechloromonas denitrificans]
MSEVPRPAVLGLIGNTPLIEVTRLDTGPCQLFLKLESQNPGGSIKDRVGLSMIEVAERDGRLKPGGTIIEATAGNTGLGLALVAQAKGYRIILVVPDKMSTEKILHLKALGAEVHITRSDVGKGHPAYYQDYAARLAAEIPGSFFADQFNNPANPAAHEQSTAPEIWAQTAHAVDAIVVGVGSAGTITGLTNFFRRASPNTEFVLADPVGSILTDYVTTDYVTTGRFGEAGSWAVEGIGEDFVPPIADLSGVKHAYAISDKESFATARELLRSEGILGGSSTGTLLAAALRYCRAQTTPKRVVSFVCDTGTRYLSKVYNDNWLIDQGLISRPAYGDLRDIIARRFEEGSVISVALDDNLQTAFQRMRYAEISQLPVIEKGRIVGLIDESDLLLRVQADQRSFQGTVASAMTEALETLRPDASLEALQRILDRGLVAIVADEQGFHGLITHFDLLNYLRKKIA